MTLYKVSNRATQIEKRIVIHAQAYKKHWKFKIQFENSKIKNGNFTTEVGKSTSTVEISIFKMENPTLYLNEIYNFARLPLRNS